MIRNAAHEVVREHDVLVRLLVPAADPHEIGPVVFHRTQIRFVQKENKRQQRSFGRPGFNVKEPERIVAPAVVRTETLRQGVEIPQEVAFTRPTAFHRYSEEAITAIARPRRRFREFLFEMHEPHRFGDHGTHGRFSAAGLPGKDREEVVRHRQKEVDGFVVRVTAPSLKVLNQPTADTGRRPRHRRERPQRGHPTAVVGIFGLGGFYRRLFRRG